MGAAVYKVAAAGKSIVAEPAAVTNAEACFRQSIKIAQQQRAKSLELRAVMSVARLYQKQGRQKEAKSLLAQIYDRFTEGFDTVDLQEAKALLSELL
jgi:predicted ATPase